MSRRSGRLGWASGPVGQARGRCGRWAGMQAGQAAVSFFNHCVQTANTLSWPPFETTVVIAAAAQGFINISVFGYPLLF